MSQKELRALIRQRVSAGQLPSVLGGKTFAGRGSNTACDCCGQIIGRHEAVYEVQLTSACRQFRQSLIVHTQCHWIWWEESGAQSSPPETAGSHSLVWNTLKVSVAARMGGPVN